MSFRATPGYGVGILACKLLGLSGRGTEGAREG